MKNFRYNQEADNYITFDEAKNHFLGQGYKQDPTLGYMDIFEDFIWYIVDDGFILYPIFFDYDVDALQEAMANSLSVIYQIGTDSIFTRGYERYYFGKDMKIIRILYVENKELAIMLGKAFFIENEKERNNCLKISNEKETIEAEPEIVIKNIDAELIEIYPIDDRNYKSTEWGVFINNSLQIVPFCDLDADILFSYEVFSLNYVPVSETKHRFIKNGEYFISELKNNEIMIEKSFMQILKKVVP